ncbi:MAG: MarC family protein [Elusimicrobiota bacterium]
MTEFLLCFIPLFIAVDAVGVLPIFIGLVEGIDPLKVRKIIIQSVLTAYAVSIIFIYFGVKLLDILGITVPDFMVAGGILLFTISISDLLSYEKRQRQIDPESLGAVPLGVPLIAGPAVLTTSIILINEYGALMTVASLVINITIAGVIFMGSGSIYRLLGKAGSRTLSKLAALLLAAFSVSIIRRGIMEMF